MSITYAGANEWLWSAISLGNYTADGIRIQESLFSTIGDKSFTSIRFNIRNIGDYYGGSLSGADCYLYMGAPDLQSYSPGNAPNLLQQQSITFDGTENPQQVVMNFDPNQQYVTPGSGLHLFIEPTPAGASYGTLIVAEIEFFANEHPTDPSAIGVNE